MNKLLEALSTIAIRSAFVLLGWNAGIVSATTAAGGHIAGISYFTALSIYIFAAVFISTAKYSGAENTVRVTKKFGSA